MNKVLLNRDSSVELLRILCMFMIVVHHIIIGEFYSVPTILEGEGTVDTLLGGAVILNSFCYIAVNCFILISGYFGIKFKWRKLYRLYIMCAFYVFITYITIGMEPQEFIRRMIGPFSSRYWRFMTEFIVLYFMSTLLNRGIDYINKKDFQTILVLYTIANVYFGFFFNQYSKNGYGVANFVYLYIIGAYLRKFVNVSKISKNKSIMVYVLCSILFGVLGILSHEISIPRYRSYAYNNPILIVGSIAFFITFLNIHFKSKLINWLAYSSLAIYLMPNFFRKEFCHELYLSYVHNSSVFIGLIIMIVISLSYAVVFSLFAIMFDKLRVYSIEKWSLSLYDWIEKKYKLIDN